jgi:hypothetical protein
MLLINSLPLPALNLVLSGLQEWSKNGPHGLSPRDNQHKDA